MLVGDVEAAGGPVVTDGSHRRAEHVKVKVLGAVRGAQCGLEESPRFRLVTPHEQRRQSTHIVLLRRPARGGVAAGWRRGGDRVEVGVAHVPMSSDPPAGKPPGADVSISRHVVHAEQIGCLLQRQVRVLTATALLCCHARTSSGSQP